MKKKIFSFLLLIIVVGTCSACEGDITRALRHDGFAVGSDFDCDPFYRGVGQETIKYLTANQIITTEGRIYDVSLGQKFSNNSNCKIADTSLKVVATFDDKVFKADDGNIYTMVADNNVPAYTQVTPTDNSYAIYEILLKPEGTIKAMTADSSNGIYYVLKSDGNVYGITISNQDRNIGPMIVSTVIVYSKNDFLGDIIDFNYSGNSSATFVKTIDRFFKMVATNKEDCTKYADIVCTYEMVESSTLEENKDYILAYNGHTLITTYKKIFSAA